jgi:Zinc finger, C3HC4 type (RING finger)
MLTTWWLAVTPSAFEALEGLDDDVDPAHLRVSKHSDGGKAQHGPACPHSPVPESKLPAPVRKFADKLRGKGLWEHNSFTNALNPVTRMHDPALRTAYATLSKAHQKVVWQIIPHATPDAPAHKRSTSGIASSPPTVTKADRAASSSSAQPVARVSATKAANTGARGRRVKRAEGLSWSPVTDELSLSPDNFGGQLDVAEGPLGDGEPREAEANLCVVCMDRKRDALLMPCKHRVICLMCAFQVQDCSGECPYCRRGIEDIMHLQ